MRHATRAMIVRLGSNYKLTACVSSNLLMTFGSRASRIGVELISYIRLLFDKISSDKYVYNYIYICMYYVGTR